MGARNPTVEARYKPGGMLCYFAPEGLDKWQRSVRVAMDEEIESQAQAYIIKTVPDHNKNH